MLIARVYSSFKVAIGNVQTPPISGLPGCCQLYAVDFTLPLVVKRQRLHDVCALERGFVTLIAAKIVVVVIEGGNIQRQGFGRHNPVAQLVCQQFLRVVIRIAHNGQRYWEWAGVVRAEGW